MLALTFSEADGVQLRRDYPIPVPKAGEALVQVIIAQICSTDLEIVKGYVPGFNHVLGHEFCGRVTQCESKPELVGRHVVAEINCNDANFCCGDPIFQRNHAPGRSVLGIINRDGCMAEFVALPAENLHVVPEGLRDNEACFAEPLAAACRIVEQGLAAPGCSVAVLGDGKLGLLVAQVLVTHGCQVTLTGRNENKLSLVQGLHATVLLPRSSSPEGESSSDPLVDLEGKFDLVVEASGSSMGIQAALRLTRPLGTVVLKSTVSLAKGGVQWSAVANDVVVNEKVLAGSRCGPMDVALKAMTEHEAVVELLRKMVSRCYSIEEGVQAMEHAATKGTLKECWVVLGSWCVSEGLEVKRY